MLRKEAGKQIAQGMRSLLDGRFPDPSRLLPFDDLSGLMALLPDQGTLTPTLRKSIRAGQRQIALLQVAHQSRLISMVRQLRAHSIEPILVKGWSVARLYPQVEARRGGDVDLCVAPDQLKQAIDIFERSPDAGWIDLHAGISELPDRPWSDLLDRSRCYPLDGEPIRVLCSEDQLTQLALHFWRHLGERPLWLVDLVFVLRSLEPSFNWSLCLGQNKARRQQILGVLGLAQRLLGAELPEEIALEANRCTPRWLEQAILWQWGEEGTQGRKSRQEQLDFLAYKTFNPLRAAHRLQMGPRTPVAAIQIASILARPWQGVVRLRRGYREHVVNKQPTAVEVHRDRVF
jgi:hypothetical protein